MATDATRTTPCKQAQASLKKAKKDMREAERWEGEAEKELAKLKAQPNPDPNQVQLAEEVLENAINRRQEAWRGVLDSEDRVSEFCPP